MNQSNKIRFSHFRKMIAVICMMVLTVTSVLLSTAWAYAEGPREIVRVGWFESPFNTTDELQRRSGYAYDYQQKIAAYTGWTYEYVEGSWSDLLKMLEDGRIDLLSDVSYTDEREDKMLYSALPMGEEDYCLFAASDNKEISAEDFSTFNGKKVGVNKGSIQIDLFRQWEKDNGVQTEIVELSGSEGKNIEKLMRGDIDMYLSLEGFFDKGDAVPVCRIGSSDFYFAVSKSRPELLTELNNAMSRIHNRIEYISEYRRTGLAGCTRPDPGRVSGQLSGSMREGPGYGRTDRSPERVSESRFRLSGKWPSGFSARLLPHCGGRYGGSEKR